MVDIEAFESPVAVLPDLDGDSNAYFMIKDRTEWRTDFFNWLENPSEEDIMDFSDIDEECKNSDKSSDKSNGHTGVSSQSSVDV